MGSEEMELDCAQKGMISTCSSLWRRAKWSSYSGGLIIIILNMSP